MGGPHQLAQLDVYELHGQFEQSAGLQRQLSTCVCREPCPVLVFRASPGVRTERGNGSVHCPLPDSMDLGRSSSANARDARPVDGAGKDAPEDASHVGCVWGSAGVVFQSLLLRGPRPFALQPDGEIRPSSPLRPHLGSRSPGQSTVGPELPSAMVYHHLCLIRLMFCVVSVFAFGFFWFDPFPFVCVCVCVGLVLSCLILSCLVLCLSRLAVCCIFTSIVFFNCLGCSLRRLCV